jgi:hypothetical protein
MGHDIKVEVKRGGASGKPIIVLGGYGDTVAAAVKDALTANGATMIRKGDVLIIKAE